MKCVTFTVSHGPDSRHLIETKFFPLLRECKAFAANLDKQRAYKIIRTVTKSRKNTDGFIETVQERIV